MKKHIPVVTALPVFFLRYDGGLGSEEIYPEESTRGSSAIRWGTEYNPDQVQRRKASSTKG